MILAAWAAVFAGFLDQLARGIERMVARGER